MKHFSLAVAAAVVLAAGSARADVLDVGTVDNASNWKITGAGAAGATAIQVGSGMISLTSDAQMDGTFVAGGSLANFNGFWYADLSFFLPADATGAQLTFSGLSADDRVVLQLNGTNVANSGIFAPGEGAMSFSQDGPNVSYYFNGITSGVITSGFLLGADNDLRLVVNRTGDGIYGTTQTFDGLGEGAYAGMTATLTYVPEPSTLVLLGIAALGLLGYARRCRA